MPHSRFVIALVSILIVIFFAAESQSSQRKDVANNQYELTLAILLLNISRNDNSRYSSRPSQEKFLQMQPLSLVG